jgi:methyltransferase (TIGR00027 family)
VRAALAGGVRQILLLGAGFDCRALRMPELRRGAARVFEADLREQLAEKRAILAAADHEIPPWNVHVGCDFGAAAFEATLASALSEAGYDPAARTLVVLEGVANYLDAGVLDRVLAFAADRTPRESRTVFNYARYRLDPDTLPARLAGLGYAAVETWTAAELYRRYTGRGVRADVAGAAEQFCISRATR